MKKVIKIDNFINLKDLLYPIGAVYISKYGGLDNCTAHNPAQVFGGTGEEIYFYKPISYGYYVDSPSRGSDEDAPAGAPSTENMDYYLYYYLDNSVEYKDFFNYNENTKAKEKVKYYVRIA